MIILGSASPRRQELLAAMGYVFEVKCADVVEYKCADSAENLPLLNAQLKADHIAKNNPNALVIGADTVIIFENCVLGKPDSLTEARKVLKNLSGKSHQVVTAVSLRSFARGYKDDFSCSTIVKFKNYSDEDIDLYLSKVNVLDKAGSYAIQEFGDMIVESIDGYLDNVIGLPCTPLQERLERCKILWK